MYERINRNSFAQFMRSRVRMLHLAKLYRPVQLAPGAPVTYVADKGVTYNVGRNKAKRERRCKFAPSRLDRYGNAMRSTPTESAYSGYTGP